MFLQSMLYYSIINPEKQIIFLHDMHILILPPINWNIIWNSKEITR